ncbi:unnamed protein product [Citrullus colocynthis]|uniref:Uncharacterized protein n=1 Tax=Citrullus colocynthis TaxID=252529 RepID=A0ABP0Y2B2_9ROSI
MKKWCSKGNQIRSEEYGRGDVDWELRPGGMLVQKRHVGSGSGSNSERFITINVSHGSYRHQITVDSHSTFGDLKTVLRQQTGLEPREQRLLLKGKEKENDEWLHMAGVNDMSKLILMEDPASKERKLQEMKKNTTAAGEALAGIRAEVDKLSEKVAAVEGGVNDGKRVEEKEVNLLIELLMMQLLKLDAIETDDNSKLQRRTQVIRVQELVDRVDQLKVRILNPLNLTTMKRVSSSRGKWEAFESGFGSLIPPTSKLTISSTKITQDWELFD